MGRHLMDPSVRKTDIINLMNSTEDVPLIDWETNHVTDAGELYLSEVQAAIDFIKSLEL